jgi:hypothetical protein
MLPKLPVLHSTYLAFVPSVRICISALACLEGPRTQHQFRVRASPALQLVVVWALVH